MLTFILGINSKKYTTATAETREEKPDLWCLIPNAVLRKITTINHSANKPALPRLWSICSRLYQKYNSYDFKIIISKIITLSSISRPRLSRAPTPSDPPSTNLPRIRSCRTRQNNFDRDHRLIAKKSISKTRKSFLSANIKSNWTFAIQDQCIRYV